MANQFFLREQLDLEPPREVYALFDRVEGDYVLFEAVDAKWFDEEFQGEHNLARWSDTSAKAPISIIDIPWREPFQRIAPQLWRYFKFAFLMNDDVPNRWFRILLDNRPGEALIHMTLYDAGRPITVTHVGPLTPPKIAALRATFNLAPHITTTRAIDAALSELANTRIEWVGVYDVGQGSASALCDSKSVPLAYFDLGGGVMGNSSTFPNQLNGICTVRDPPVILSHWDWDHWSFGSRAPAAKSMTWLVPNQTLGAVHGTFAADIVKNGRLLVWPNTLANHPVGSQLLIEKCTGRSGRNATGLALVVEGPGGEDPILLTGDARYTTIPSHTRTFTAMVAPHHGADMQVKTTPRPSGSGPCRIAYSYGPSNIYGHAKTVTYDRHHKAGWPQRWNRPPGPQSDRHTADRLGGHLGHIGLGWTSAPLPSACGCGCDLQLQQQ